MTAPVIQTAGGKTGGYIRVSSTKQRDESDSPSSQRQRLKEAGCTRFYEDLAVSGFKLESRRHAVEFQAMWRDIASGQLDRLIAVRLDRYARRDSIVLDLAEHCERHGVEFVTLASGTIDTSTATGWLSVKMQLVIAEHFSRQLSENVRGGYRGLWAQGIPARSSKLLPLQLQRVPGTRHGVEESQAWDDCREVIDRVLRGDWNREQCSNFIWERYQTLKTPAAMTKWLKAAHQLGHMTTRAGEIIVANCWPALCNQAEHHEIHERLSPGPPRWGMATKSEIKALSGLLRCVYCGDRVSHTGPGPRPSGRRYLYLRCRRPLCVARYKLKPAQALEQWLFMQYLGDFLDRVAMAHAAQQAPLVVSPRLLSLRKELKAREALPAEFRSVADARRLLELQQEIEREQVSSGGIDPAVIALLDERLRVVPKDPRWPEPCFLGQTEGDHWGWLEAPGMDRSGEARNRDLRRLINSITVDALAETPDRWIVDIDWRLQLS
jgi:DNA invertase Pin-like site-specific DNA recombinase